MTDKSVWFVTGAGRGMGIDIVKAALAAGHAVVATGRNSDAVAKAVGKADPLLVTKLDVTRPDDANAAVAAARHTGGRLKTFRKPVVDIDKRANLGQKTDRSGAKTHFGHGLVLIHRQH